MSEANHNLLLKDNEKMCSFESVHMNVSMDVCDIYSIKVTVNKITVMIL